MRLLIGVSGGIAAYKAVETARLAVKAGHSVRVIQTPASERFVGRASFAGITGAPVLTDEFETDASRGAYPGEPLPEHAPINHLALVERADVFLIAPASANTLAKLAGGLADNLLTTAALAADCPVVVAPAMNDRMYRHPATRANLALLADRGVVVLEPGEGALASHGERGVGRLPEPAELLAACELAVGSDGSWAGLKVLVTAGGTQEPIDSVRFIGNRSSGRMGIALAAAALARGAEVSLVAANVSLPLPAGARVTAVRTAAELAAACRREFEQCDVLLMAAAVADFRPAATVAHKLKKDGPTAGAPVALVPTEDILTALTDERRPGQFVLGFAAEHGEGAVAYARAKLARKRLDAIVLNDVSDTGIGFEAPDNEVLLIAADGREKHLSRRAKGLIADALLDEIAILRRAETPSSLLD
jgi:phosphopantothenoylcysteine decarboxylase/phosphopantothenate--cysteine ligase